MARSSALARHPRRATATLMLVLGLALVALVPAAHATQLKGGTTTLTLDPAVVGVLTGAGISIAPVAPATAAGASLSFPITGGKIAPNGVGGLQHPGGVTISYKGKSVALTRFYVNTYDKKPYLSGNVAGGGRARLFDLDLSGAKITPTSGGARVSGVKAALNTGAAGALNGALGTALPGSIVLGTVVVDVKLG